MNDREIDAFFERLHWLSDVDLAMLAGHRDTDELRAARSEAERVARASDRERFADLIEGLRRWATDAGTYPAAGIAGQPMNANALQLRIAALPAIHDALLAVAAGGRLRRNEEETLRSTWDDVTTAPDDGAVPDGA